MMLREQERLELIALLEELSPREEQMLRMYYGLDREEFFTLDEIGVRFAITRERVRQIILRTLERNAEIAKRIWWRPQNVRKHCPSCTCQRPKGKMWPK